MPKRAFTLVEMLICIAIIGLLLSLLIPQVNRARDVARQTLCAGQQRQIGISFQVYMTGNRDWVPRLLGTIGEVTTPARQVVSTPILASSVTEEVRTLFPTNIRFCPSYGVRNPTGETRWTYLSPLMQNNQVGQQWNSYLLWHRTSSNNAYVRLSDTKLLNEDNNSAINLKGAEFRFYTNLRTINPIRTFPLLADMLTSNVSGTPRRAAAHNGGTAYSITVRNIDSEGSNHLWIDGSVNWKKWPDNQKNTIPVYGTQIRNYPYERAANVHPEGWSAAGNYYYNYYFWVKNQ